MPEITNKQLEAFSKAIKGNPRLLDTLKKRSELEDFKEKYHVTKSSPLKCPSCSQWQMSGGSLWIDPSNSSRFVCKKCHLVWIITCETLPIEDLINQMKQATKET